jgi:hypothetical protein
MKIYDCFIFNNELDVLEVRLHELYSVVDHFVIVEARETFMGNPKPFHFRDHLTRFSPFTDKIIHVPVGDLPESNNPWVREYFQRDCIGRGLGDLKDDDLVLISDVDEILRRDVVASLRTDRHDLFGFRLPLFYLRFNYVNIAGDCVHEVLGVGLRGRVFRSAQASRDLGRNMEGLRNWLRLWRQNARLIPHAGWHFSYLGDEAQIAHKLRNFSHQELNDPDLIARLDLEEILAQRRDLFGHPIAAWEIVVLDDYFPRHVVENRDRFKTLIAPGAARTMEDLQKLLDWEAHPLSRFWKVMARKRDQWLKR